MISTIDDLQHHMENIKHLAQKSMMPEYLKPGEVFLGKYKVESVVSQREISRNHFNA
jgi:hypothetical protein